LDLVRLCPLGVAALVWEPAAGETRLTVCVKATYALVHGEEAVLAPHQEEATDDASPQATLFVPSDFVPFKPRADVLLVGHARAPGGVPVDSLSVRLRVGDFSKGLRITGDRLWASGPEGMRPGPTAPFVEMPLRYERGVRRGENLVGLDPSPHRQEAGRPLPNIDVTETRTPGFGPLPARWRARLHSLSEPALAWAQGSGAACGPIVSQSLRTAPAPAPPGFDFGFFNVAPRDQQIDVLSSTTTLSLENLVADHPRFETRLPPLTPRVFRVDPRTGRATPVELRCDTLWIDCDRALAVLSWRGATPLDPADAGDAGQVVVLMEGCGQAKRDAEDAAPPPSVAAPVSVAPPPSVAPASVAPPSIPAPAQGAPPPPAARPPSVAPLPRRSPSAAPPPITRPPPMAKPVPVAAPAPQALASALPRMVPDDDETPDPNATTRQVVAAKKEAWPFRPTGTFPSPETVDLPPEPRGPGAPVGPEAVSGPLSGLPFRPTPPAVPEPPAPSAGTPPDPFLEDETETSAPPGLEPESDPPEAAST
jgi:hypothetical protein